ncbi:hypothetical protein [Geodermatophilus sp. SYSU D01119]
MNAGEWVGLGLQLLGTVTAAWAAFDMHRKNDGEEIVPGLRRAVAAVRRLFRRPQVVYMDGIASARATAHAPTVYVITPAAEDAPLAEQVRYLRTRLAQVEDHLDRTKTRLADADRGIVDQVRETEERLDGQVTALAGRVTSNATDGVRLELFGLLVAGVGSVISTVAG